jgi:hypothetical protein
MGKGGLVRHKQGFLQHTGLTSSSIALGDGNKLINTIKLEMETQELVLAKIYRTIWLGSRSGDNWFPYGSNIDQALYDFFSEQGAYYIFDGVDNTLSPTPDNIDQAIFIIKNNSGGSKTFLFDADVRYLLNQSGTGELG